MTSGENAPNPQERVFDDPELEELNSKLNQAKELLISWVESEDSDSIARQNLRVREYAEACAVLESIWSDTYRTGKSMALTMPSEGEPFRSQYFSKNAYDFIERHIGKELEPEEMVLLRRHETLTSIEQRATIHYFGDDLRRYFEVADIGRILSAGGTLELTDTHESE